MKQIASGVILWVVVLLPMVSSCASGQKSLTKPVEQAATEIGKVRTLEREGETRAVLAPQDERKIKFTF